jgi:hypothetical protein
MADFPYDQSATQAQKAAALANDQRVRKDTFHSREEAAHSLAYQGRHAQSINLTGSWDSHARHPRLPETSPSNQMALVPPEPPLGVEIDAHDPVGEYHEQFAKDEPKGPSAVSLPSDAPAGALATELDAAAPARSVATPSPTLRKRGLR